MTQADKIVQKWIYQTPQISLKEAVIGAMKEVFELAWEASYQYHCNMDTTVSLPDYPTLKKQLFGNRINQSGTDVHPIPLTDEWLLKFGFNKMLGWVIGFGDARSANSLNHSLELGINNDTSEIQWYVYLRDFVGDVEDGFVCIRKDLKFVHQLQNLYFGLTGRYLIIQSGTDVQGLSADDKCLKCGELKNEANRH